MIHNIDIAVHGAGIAGLWLLDRLRAAGYHAVLFESRAIGGVQTVASQGIIHAGLKYALTGKINPVARAISEMPVRWQAALSGHKDSPDLSTAPVLTASQNLLMAPGPAGHIVKTMTGHLLDAAASWSHADWPVPLKDSGFKGAALRLEELVLDVPGVIRALAAPHKSRIYPAAEASSFSAKLHVHTAAAGNAEAAACHGHDHGLKTQKRPLLMGLIKPAPFALWAHLIGLSDKPVASITTHTGADGVPVWYIGGGVAERAKDDDPAALYADITKALRTYMPRVDLSDVLWAAYPVDRVEGGLAKKGQMPNAPFIHEADRHLYGWPTKLTFAPLLADMVMERIRARGLTSSAGESYGPSPVSAAPVDYAPPPWDKVSWTQWRAKS